MSLLRRRSPGRSCSLHGDNGCEIQGEAGTRERHHDKRAWQAEVGADLLAIAQAQAEVPGPPIVRDWNMHWLDEID